MVLDIAVANDDGAGVDLVAELDNFGDFFPAGWDFAHFFDGAAVDSEGGEVLSEEKTGPILGDGGAEADAGLDADREEGCAGFGGGDDLGDAVVLADETTATAAGYNAFFGAAEVDVDPGEAHAGDVLGCGVVFFGIGSPDLDDEGLGQVRLDAETFHGAFAAGRLKTVGGDEFSKEDVGGGDTLNDLPEDDIGDVVHGGKDKEWLGELLPKIHFDIIALSLNFFKTGSALGPEASTKVADFASDLHEADDPSELGGGELAMLDELLGGVDTLSKEFEDTGFVGAAGTEYLGRGNELGWYAEGFIDIGAGGDSGGFSGANEIIGAG